MRKFKRKGNAVTSHLSTYEVDLLSSLIHQLVTTVSEGQPEQYAPDSDVDPFDALARDLSADPDAPENPDDPVLRRLFPNAYPHDDQASSDFRRFTERTLRTKKIADAQSVLDQLAETDGGARELRIPLDQADVWLRTLTSLRLAVATRLGVSDAESAEELAQISDDDPRAFMVSIYDWLGFAEETLVSAL